MSDTYQTRTIPELTDLLKGLGDRLNGLRDRPEGERSANWRDDIRNTTSEIYAADAELTIKLSLDRAERADSLSRIPGNGPSAGTGQMTGMDRRTAGQMFSQAPDVQEWLTRAGGRGESPGVEVSRRALLDTTTTGYGTELLPAGQPFIAPGAISRRRLFIRDMIAPGQTTLNSVPYVRELNPRTNELGASAVAEGSDKPEVTITFVDADAPVRKIAAWVPISREALADIPTLESYVNGRLPYMVMVREEQEMLYGSGTPPQIEGIGVVSGYQSQAYSTDQVTTVGLAISKIELVDGEADGIAINPADFWTIATTRSANQFDGAAVGNAPFGAPPTTLWGLPAVRTRAVTSGEAIVGSWRLGAQVFDRETVTIRVTDSHSDYFIKNKLVVLAESRLALAVHRPDFFVLVDLTS